MKPATAKTGDPTAIWQRLTKAQRRALKLMANGNCLFQTYRGYRAIGDTTKVSLTTVRHLRAAHLARSFTSRYSKALTLTTKGTDVLDAVEQTRAKRLANKAERDAVIALNRRDYHTAMQGCGQCVDGYTSACPTPDTCPTPTSGCAHCIKQCEACFHERIDA